jgi:vacuolar-type H+-ATPase subunit F/Vma7
MAESSQPTEPAGIAIIGEGAKVSGFGLAGAKVFPAEEPEAVWAAWRSLDPNVAVVVLTSRAARTLATARSSWPLTVVMPP